VSQAPTRFPWRRYRAPRYWSTWAGLGVLWLLTRLPFGAVQAIGRGLGPLVMRLLRERARATRTNIELALPTLSGAERERIARASARHAGMSAMEIAWLWCRPGDDMSARATLLGTEHVDAALARGQGVILLQAHFSVIDFAGSVVGKRWTATGVYDPPKDPLIAALQLWHRQPYLDEPIPNRNVRSMVRRLRRGEMIWFSPDQAVSASHGGIPTRFFGQPVLSSSGTARILAMTDAVLIPMVPQRRDDGRHLTVRFHPPIQLDTDDTVAATQAVNDLLEAQVRALPEQYLWGHKRFKPPPGTVPSPYR